MINVNNMYKKSKKDIKATNMKNFKLAMEDKDFANIAYRTELSEDVLCMYTSKIEETVKELNNCKNCKGIEYCKNTVSGYVKYPTKEGEALVFSYTPCKYKKEILKSASKVTYYETPKKLREAKMKDIYLDDKARVEVLKYIKEFMGDYPNKKGVYLYGSFGSGKSYILNAVLNELSRKGSSCVSIYYPTLLRTLKESFNSKDDDFGQIYDELIRCDALLIDDIGAENNTPWARDEILSGILQSRMDEEKITFFTSNYNLTELEEHLSRTSNGIEKVKARRLIERIKQLSKPIKLVGENKREV